MNLFTRIAFIFILLCFSETTARAQTANFTEDYISGCAPLVVHFTNTSTGATSYSWDLGNGVITAITNPSTSYLIAGTYVVTLTAYSGSSTSTHTVTITVYPTPTVSFYADDTSVCMGAPVTFTSTTTSGVAGPMTYSWNFGDGTSSTATTPTHVFPAPGYYNITLSATNAQGCVSSLTKTVYIHVLPPPLVSFSTSSTYVCDPPGSITFTNTSTGVAPFTCSWSFGDGSTGTGTSTSHTYSGTGSYTIKLVVTDANGCKDSVTIPSLIYAGSVTAAFPEPGSACVNTPVTFTNTSSTHTSSSWTFGDGGTSTLNDGIHTYTTPGTYTVTLVVWNGPCSSTVTHTIIILPLPAASFTITPSQACPAPASVTFTATGPPGATFTWSFGDGGTGSGSPTTHTYGSNGIYTVNMTCTSSSGCVRTLSQVYSIYDLHSNINHDSVVGGCVPLTALFHCYTWTTIPGISPYPYGIASYSWNFGDGSPTVPGGVAISHTYTATGTYTCTVYIVTTNGCMDTAHLLVTVGNHPTASFTTDTVICYNQVEAFHNTSTGATNYLWLFGDGFTSTATDPSHFYTLPGNFIVTLIAYDRGCPDTFVFNHVRVDSPKAIINAVYACNPANEIIFGDSSLGDNSHIWFFGDGTTSTADNIIHFYPSLTTYTVTLTTFNSSSGCRDTAALVINLINPSVTFTGNDTTICKYESVLFTPVTTGDSTAMEYYWYQDGAFMYHGKYFTDVFTTTGLHTIMLITRDLHGCADTFKRINYILVAKPDADFSLAPSSGCVPLTVHFTDHTTDVSGTTLTNFAWAFGDGATTSITTTTTAHTYTAAGTYSVTEIITDNIGCKDTATVPLSVYQPLAAFFAVPTTPCVGATVNFTNTSTGAVSSFWMFGDGGTATSASPTHIYTAPGIYSVTLIVTDVHGCTDTAKIMSYINVTQPVADFSMSDSFSVCAPLSEDFTNLSTGATSFAWTFGDGNSSTNVSPNNLYITSGFDTVMLIATNAYGCNDTAIKFVNVFGYAGGFSFTPDTGCAPLTVYFTSVISNVPSIIWDFGDGTTSSASSTQDTVHVYTIPGGYIPKLILSDNTGCQNSSQGDTIKVDGVTAAFSNGPACLGDSIHFSNTSTSYWSAITNVLWTFGSDNSTLNDPAYLYNTTGTYTVTLVATDAWGCTGTISQEIVIAQPPVITASPDTTICVGDQATLTGYGGVSYAWTPPASLSCSACNPAMAGPSVVTTYTVIGTDEHGCTNFDTVTVFLKTQTVTSAYGDTAVCIGTTVQIWDSGATKYTWTPPTGLSNSTIADPLATPQVTTTYTVTAQLGSCAPDVHYVTIIVYPLPTVDAGPDQTLLAGSEAQIQATGSNISTYSWSPDATLSCDSCANPVGSMSVTTTYTVNVTSSHGCRNSDSVTIHLYCSSSQVFIPNSFTPNGDGKNDEFYPRGTGVSKIKSFRVYNRWGELMFERDNIDINDETNGWNGSFGGATPRPDVYVYIVDAICETGEPIFIKGDVTIIR